MAKHKFQTELARLQQAIVTFHKTLTGQCVRWYLRATLVTKRWQQGEAAGFVLPTIAFMLMVVSLVVAAILFRTFSRSSQVIQQGQTDAITNAATPAIERAKSKLEYMFTSDPRIPAGIPGEDVLESMLLNDDNPAPALATDPYTLPGEARIDINKDGIKDNAWKYEKDGITTVYALISRAERDNKTIDPSRSDVAGIKVVENDSEKASSLLVRNGPVLTTVSNSDAKCPAGGGDSPVGWFATNDTFVFKNFQVVALAIPTALTNGGTSSNQAIATLQYQQDRTFERGNKWGAWFRYDLEVYPLPTFNWNGSIHTEGNFYTSTNNVFGSYLISSKYSCFFNPSFNSSISNRGYLVAGTIRDDNYIIPSTGKVEIYRFEDSENPAKDTITQSTDAIDNSGGATPTDISTDPLLLLVRSISAPRVPSGTSWKLDSKWNDTDVSQRVGVGPKNASCPPYVDDTYRADNRYGPKPSYEQPIIDRTDPNNPICAPQPIGTPGTDIAQNPPAAGSTTPVDKIIRNDPLVKDQVEDVGLDGYWERRARNEGLRVLVGQRLELGNPFGWYVDADNNDTTADQEWLKDLDNPDRDLYPRLQESSTTDPSDRHPTWATAASPRRVNEARQYRTLRDNLAAVQATAVYHRSFGNGGYFPVACLATTVHPGSQKTLENSTTFSRPQNSVAGFENIFKTKAGAASIFGNQFGEAGTNNEILSNFLMGEGTNGWEYQPVRDVNNNGQTDANDLNQFVFDVNNAAGPLRIALRNLANFAGDPDGAFPPKQETAGSIVHPYPILTMWGDFSNLRRALDSLDSGAKRYPSPSDNSTDTRYLSLADQSYIQTAACTLGMLAYNVSYLQEFAYGDPSDASKPDNRALLKRLDKRLQELSETGTGDPGKNGEVRVESNVIKVYQNDTTQVAQVAGTVPPPDAFIAALEARVAALSGADKDKAKADLELFKLIHLKEQVERDRKFGFRDTPATADVYEYPLTEQGSFTFGGVTYDNTNKVKVGCDFSKDSGNNYFGFGKPGATPTTEDVDGNGTKDATDRKLAEQRFIRLAKSLCPTQAKFPSLYYLFPKYTHTHQGNTGVAIPNTVLPGDPKDYMQPGNSAITSSPPPSEPYVTDNYINATVNTAAKVQYRVLDDSKGAIVGVEDGNDNGIAQIALKPRILAAGGNRCGTNWCLPTAAGNGGANTITDRVTNAGQVSVPFLDKAIFDGREVMNVRVLDFDLDLLRRQTTAPDDAQDAWLPASGLVYAFREDAVREDAIARPALMAAASYASYPKPYSSSGSSGVWVTSKGNPTGAANRMNVWTPADPPLIENFSPKPVDYYPDPDRRSYGFRLQKGSELTRKQFADNSTQNLRGLSLISDNPVYIQGDFNLHNGQEFQEPLSDDFSNFYTRKNLNTSFARPAGDPWRVSEIIADAVNILSNNWKCDGTIQSGIRSNNGACQTGTSSYRNSHFIGDPSDLAAPSLRGQGYICENPFDPRTASSEITSSYVVSSPNNKGCDGPIKVFRNGEIKYYKDASNIASYTNYRNFNTDRRDQLNVASDTRVNTIMVSGLVPSRKNGSNGGLHNFPRFLEYWDKKPYTLYFSGSMLQLNFSNYATGPYDQDAWEPNQDPTTAEANKQNRAPTRRWGYDVGLQYAPAGPVAKRMVTPASERSEFYRELPANDPYICLLRNTIGYKCP